MGPIRSSDPPAGAFSNPSNGKHAVSVRDRCQGRIKPTTRPIHHQDTKTTKYLLIHHNANPLSGRNPLHFMAIGFR